MLYQWLFYKNNEQVSPHQEGEEGGESLAKYNYFKVVERNVTDNDVRELVEGGPTHHIEELNLSKECVR